MAVVDPFAISKSRRDVTSAVAYRARMLPHWIAQLNPAEPVDVTMMAPTLLRGLYPNVYYWGVRGDDLAENLTRIVHIFDEQLDAYAAAAAASIATPDRRWLAVDLLTTYSSMHLTKTLLTQDMRQLFDYVAALQEAGLFELAYRNVDVAELNGENIFVAEEDTILHRYYQHAIWDTAGYADASLKVLGSTLNNMRVVLSTLPRLVLSAPILPRVPTFNSDWLAHVAFCDRWGLTP